MSKVIKYKQRIADCFLLKKFSLLAVTAIFLIVTSCSKGRIKMATDSASIYKEDTYQIEAESKLEIKYTSENEYHATVNPNGLVLANYVGSTTIKLETEERSKDFTINVIPRSNLYTEAEFKFGITKADAISNNGQPNYDEGDCYIYKTGNEDAPYFMIFFDDKNLTDAYIYAVSKRKGVELKDFLNERYNYYDQFDEWKVYINGLDLMDASMAIYYSYSSEAQVFLVYYMDVNAKHNPNEITTKISKFIANTIE